MVLLGAALVSFSIIFTGYMMCRELEVMVLKNIRKFKKQESTNLNQKNSQ